MIITTDYSNRKYFSRYIVQKLIPPCFYPIILKWKYKNLYKENLNLKNPLKLSEKIQWMKLYEKNPLKTELSDKLKAKTYVKELIPKLNIAKVYAEAEHFENINLDKLPDTFIIKTNHSWKTNLLIEDKNKITKKEYKKYADYYKSALKINYAYWSYYELQYKDIKPCIFAEEYIYNKSQNDCLIEYEAYCFNGTVEFIRVVYTFKDEYGEECCAAGTFDRFENELDFFIFFNHIKGDNINPKKLKQVISYAEILSKNINFVRIDFMEINDLLYFLELTFTPCSGFIQFTPEKYDIIYGLKLKI